MKRNEGTLRDSDNHIIGVPGEEENDKAAENISKTHCN